MIWLPGNLKLVGSGLNKFADEDDDTTEAGRYRVGFSGQGSAPRGYAAGSPLIDRRLKERLWRTLGSDIVAIALWVRSMADAAKAKKPPDFWVRESARVRVPPN